MSAVLDLIGIERAELQTLLRRAEHAATPADRERALGRALDRLCGAMTALADYDPLGKILPLLATTPIDPAGDRSADLVVCRSIGSALDRRLGWEPPIGNQLVELYGHAVEVLDERDADHVADFRILSRELQGQVCRTATEYERRVRTGTVDDRLRRTVRQVIARGWIVLQVLAVAAALPGDVEDEWHKVGHPVRSVLHVLAGPGMELLAHRDHPPWVEADQIVARIIGDSPPPTSPSHTPPPWPPAPTDHTPPGLAPQPGSRRRPLRGRRPEIDPGAAATAELRGRQPSAAPPAVPAADGSATADAAETHPRIPSSSNEDSLLADIARVLDSEEARLRRGAVQQPAPPPRREIEGPGSGPGGPLR